MNKFINSTIKGFIGISSIFNLSQGFASSRGQSFTNRPMNTHALLEVSQDDFVLQYLNEIFKNTQNLSKANGKGFLEWVPDGSLISAVPPECLPETFERKIQEVPRKSSEFSILTQDYLNHCGPFLSLNATGGLMGLLDFAMTNYPVLENSRIKSLVFKTQDGYSLNGFIGIKDQTPRPWVIFKCGVFCDAHENGTSVKNFMMNLFDQSPFNVIILANRTGQEYILANKAFTFGGAFEAQDFFDVAHWLREQSPYQSLVSSLHFMAVSLGGSATYLAERRLSTISGNDRGIAQSITSLCAVSDLQPTVENIYGNTLKGDIFSFLTWKRLSALKPILPELNDLIGTQKPANSEFPDLLGSIAVRFDRSKLNSNFTTKNFNFSEISDNDNQKKQEFWDKTKYSSYNHNSQIPLFIWASEDDSIVDYNLNTGNLVKMRSQKFDPNFGIVHVPKGEHCGFATAYGYSVTSTILRNFILTNSPEFSLSRQKRISLLNLSLPKMSHGERLINYWWSQGRGQTSTIELNLEVYGADESLCPEEWEYKGSPNCRKVVRVPYFENKFSEYGFTIPTNLVEKEALVRELNARVHLLTKGGTSIGISQWPDQFEILY